MPLFDLFLFCSRNFFDCSAMSFFNFPYPFRLNFGANAIWYWHLYFERVCFWFRYFPSSCPSLFYDICTMEFSACFKHAIYLLWSFFPFPGRPRGYFPVWRRKTGHPQGTRLVGACLLLFQRPKTWIILRLLCCETLLGKRRRVFERRERNTAGQKSRENRQSHWCFSL